MPATDEQRGWLETAIREKGRFTRKKSIEKEFAKFVRRREKVQEALDAVGYEGKAAGTLRSEVREAENLAKEGNFGKAYKALDALKKKGRALAIGRGQSIDISEIAEKVDVLDKTVKNRVALNRIISENFDWAISEVKKFEKASAKDNFEDAIETSRVFMQAAPAIQGKVEEAHKLTARLEEECKSPNMDNHPGSIVEMFNAVKMAGRESEIAALRKRFDRANNTLKADYDKLKNAKVAIELANKKNLEFEKAVLEVKDMSAWQKRDVSKVSNSPDDAKKFGIRDHLLKDTNNRIELLKAEERRLEAAKEAVRREGRTDRRITKQTGRGKIDLTPELAPFSSAAVFGDLVAVDEKLPDDIPDDKAKQLEQSAAATLKRFISGADPKSDELFDLSLKSADDFSEMLASELFGTSSFRDLTPSQQQFIEKASKTLEKTLCAENPNKMKDDGSEVSVGGKNYVLSETIKSGGNGMARRYRDPATGKTVVVKTMLKPRDAEAMIKEMKLHRRAMNGIDKDDPADSAIVNMEGAARSEDGSVHMVMEDVDGGDLEDVANSLTIMKQMGMIPDAARQVLANDLIANTTKALMEIERQGLVHHDIKGENVMMTADGRIKIIDYGEAHFGDKEGKVKGGFSGDTPGYRAPEFSDGDFDSKADAYALGGMIEKLVANMNPGGGMPHDKGAMAKLIKRLKDENPENRPSLEAVLMSSFVQSNVNDYAPEDVEDLKKASGEMAVLVAKEKVTVDKAKLVKEIPAARDWVSSNDVKLKTLQEVANFLTHKIQETERHYAKDSDGYLSVGKREIEEYKRQKKILENDIIEKAMKEKAAKGAKEYDDAIKANAAQVTFDTPNGKKTAKLKEAVAFRDKIVAKIADIQDRFYEGVSQVDGVDMNKVQLLNDKLTEADAMRRSIDNAIYNAMGPDAKFHLSKAKVEDVSRRFGQLKSMEKQEELKPDEIGDLIGALVKSSEERAVRRAVG